VVLSDVHTFVLLVHIIEKCGLATPRADIMSMGASKMNNPSNIAGSVTCKHELAAAQSNEYFTFQRQ